MRVASCPECGRRDPHTTSEAGPLYCRYCGSGNVIVTAALVALLALAGCVSADDDADYGCDFVSGHSMTGHAEAHYMCPNGTGFVRTTDTMGTREEWHS